MRHLVLIVVSFLVVQIGFSQIGVSDLGGPVVPDSAAILDLQSNSRGFLMPRLMQNERDGINNPPVGLQIYNLTSNCVDVYFPTGWRSIYCDCANPPSNQISYPGTIRQFDNVVFTPTANDPAFNYMWSFQDGTPGMSILASPTITWSTTGNKIISFSVTDTNNCPNSLTDTIDVLPCSKPNSSFAFSDTVGLNQSSNFSANGAGLTYSWTFPSGTPSTSTSQNQNVSWSAAGNYSVELITTSATGCKDTTTQVVTVNNCVTGDSVIFTTCSQTGKDGPNQSDCNSAYGGNPTVTIFGNGIQEWTVPSGICGPFTIKAYGAQGGGPQGGLGAYAEGTFSFNPGDVIRILVGQRGTTSNTQQGGSGGGGGGTFVMQKVASSLSSDQILLIAGGGGGSFSSTYSQKGANAGPNGSPSQGGQAGGSNGNGGLANPGDGGSGGGGRVNDGQDYTGGSQSHGGFSYNSGGQGGFLYQGSNASFTDGGFGGGGTGAGGSGGGGGGYSGGGGGGPAGGGGGSINNGSSPVTQGGVHSGEGMVIISW